MMTFRLSRKGTGFSFRSNQAVRLQLPGLEDPRGPARLFSLSSSPTEADILSITVKMTDSPYKERLRRLVPGETVEVAGPLGDLIYNPQAPAVMIAGGVGITPFRGMIRYAVDEGLATPITLLYSARTPEELAFRSELDELARRHPALTLRYSVTRPREGREPWTGLTGRIDEARIREASAPYTDPFYYVVGLPEMVQETLAVLQGRLGVPEERLWWEPFHGY